LSPATFLHALLNPMDDRELLEAIYASATNHAIITMDNDGYVTSWNCGAERILGFRQDDIVGRSGSVFFTEEDCRNGIPYQEFESARRTGRADDFRWHVRKDGSRFWGEGVVTPLLDTAGTRIGFLKIMYDATKKKEAEEELIRASSIDTLTGLANRAFLHDRLAEMIAAMSRSKELLLLQIIDLDYFKQINDSLGHATGDAVLQQASQRMRAVLRETDFIARLGGDEFVVLQPNAHSPEVGVTMASKIIETLSRPFLIDGHEAQAGASIGIAVFPQDAAEPEQLMKKADLALYRVKKDGRGGFSYFTEELDARAHEWGRNLIELKRSIEGQDFWLEYQPEIDCETGKIISLEALLRFSNPVLSAHSVEEIISLASDSGLMPKIGDWVMAEACAQQKKWQEAGLPPMKLSVNLCPHELMNRNISRKVDAILQQFGLHPHDLEIEITERQIYSGRGESLSILEEMRALGISIALDDFGTGYSSLSYLRHLPIDRLKLDRAFLQEIPHNHHSCVIAESVINLAHTLGIPVIAEGVESAEQVDFCRDKKCDAMQGFFFSPPLPASDLTPLLMKQAAA
jgi:diguanylate cyclase (GGDEF)-like protein/PAS domain S-box-containing protein